VKPVRIAILLAACAGTLLPAPAHAALQPAQRALLQQYVGALQAGRFDRAFALLSPDEQRYFRTPANLASIYQADGIKIDGFTIVGSTSDKLGTVAIVSERIEFFDQRRQSPAHATAKVAYGILQGVHGLAIKDPLHPWRALAPHGFAATVNGVNVTVRKVSFFTGRLELVATFANVGATTVTLLPYGRTVLRDQNGKSYPPIASRLAGLTDKTLYTGLRLAPQAEYTGLMSFLTPDRFTPTSLNLTIAPVLADGADAPFEIPLPALAVGP
jgi:hypothetical protein